MKLTGTSFFLLLLISLSSLGQGKNDSLAISFLFSRAPVQDTLGMTLRVVYKNLTDHNILIYRELKEGGAYDRFCNIAVRLERKNGAKFSNYKTSFSDPIASDATDKIDSLRYFDLPKKKLAPFASDTLALNVMENHGLIDTGEYRLNALLRVRTTRGDSTPEIIYQPSGWIYFRAVKYLSLYFLRKSRQ